MTDTRKDIVAKAILLLSPDQFTQSGLPDVSELNAAMPKGSAPVNAKERTEVWEAMKAEREKAAAEDEAAKKQAEEEAAAAEAVANALPAAQPTIVEPVGGPTAPPEGETPETVMAEVESAEETVRIRIIKANGNPFNLRINGRLVARLAAGEVVDFPAAYLPALNDTDTRYEEVQ